MQCRNLCGFAIILLLIYTLRDGAEYQEMRAPIPNERVILNTADSEVEVNIFREDIDEDFPSSQLKAVQNLPEITPHKCRETKELHRGIIFYLKSIKMRHLIHAETAGIKTTICVKHPSVDQFVSGGILSSGAWEPVIVTRVMAAVDTYPGSAFLDIGANIGDGGILMTNAQCTLTYLY